MHVIPHGVLPPSDSAHPPAELPHGFREVPGPVVLFFGLLRPYKGIDVLLEAWRGVPEGELWIVGMPRMDTAPLHRSAPARVRFLERFLGEAELRAFLSRATLVVLPYREIDASGAAFTAIGCGLPLLLSDAGGFPEIGATGCARIVPAGDPGELARALRELIGDPAALSRMAARSRAAAEGPYAWDAIAKSTLALYEGLLRENASR